MSTNSISLMTECAVSPHGGRTGNTNGHDRSCRVFPGPVPTTTWDGHLAETKSHLEIDTALEEGALPAADAQALSGHRSADV